MAIIANLNLSSNLLFGIGVLSCSMFPVLMQGGPICSRQPPKEDFGRQVPSRPLLRAASGAAHQASCSAALNSSGMWMQA